MEMKNLASLPSQSAESGDTLVGLRTGLAVILDKASIVPASEINAAVNAAISAYFASNPQSKITDLGAVNVGQTASVAILAGVRKVQCTITGAVPGDNVILVPTADMPTGYSIGAVFISANNTGQATVNGPALALGASYNIPCRALALRP